MFQISLVSHGPAVIKMGRTVLDQWSYLKRLEAGQLDYFSFKAVIDFRPVDKGYELCRVEDAVGVGGGVAQLADVIWCRTASKYL